MENELRLPLHLDLCTKILWISLDPLPLCGVSPLMAVVPFLWCMLDRRSVYPMGVSENANDKTNSIFTLFSQVSWHSQMQWAKVKWKNEHWVWQTKEREKKKMRNEGQKSGESPFRLILIENVQTTHTHTHEKFRSQFLVWTATPIVYAPIFSNRFHGRRHFR